MRSLHLDTSAHCFNFACNLWRIASVCFKCLTLSAVCANNNVSFSNTLAEIPITNYAVVTEEENLAAAWEAILALPANNKLNLGEQNPNTIFEELVEVPKTLLRELFSLDFERKAAEVVLNSQSIEIRKTVSLLIPHLSDRLLWEYKLKTSIPEPGLENNYVITLDLLHEKIYRGRRFLLKVIFATGIRVLENDRHYIYKHGDIPNQRKQVVMNYYTQILKLCHVICKIDLASIQKCQSEISRIFRDGSVCEICLYQYNRCVELLPTIVNCETGLKKKIADFENILDEETIEQLKKMEWSIRNIKDIITYWTKHHKTPEKDMRFLESVQFGIARKLPNSLKSINEDFNKLETDINLLSNELSDLVRFCREHFEVHSEISSAKILFKIFTESLNEIKDFGVVADQVFLKPVFPDRDIIYLKLASIISEGKECNDKQIVEVVRFIINTNLKFAVPCARYFPRPLLALLHSLTEYILKKETRKETSFVFAVVENSLIELLNKNEIFIADIIDFYFQIRSFQNGTFFSKYSLWSYILEVWFKRSVIDENSVSKTNKMLSISIAYSMVQWCSQALFSLTLSYHENFHDLSI